ncbi:AAA-like domain-containing protein, partial [Dapis sp. BLCC M229]|uniref:AAA-like domain-containing protein n=1 Tax=Dapis sp. BLCC M229 TaxID=3400188 RepID=UPI003CEB842D
MNIEKNQEYDYQVGNCLTPHHPTYVRRAADQELFNALKAGKYCYVLSSPQTGKSSLKVSTIKLLQAENIICIALDMTRVNNKLLTLDEWYNQVILTLEKTFIFPRHFPELWWEETADMAADEKLFLFIEEVLLANTQNERIVIFIDEVNDDSVVNSGWSSLGVLIDYCLQERANNPEFKRLTFALLGMTIPNNLVDVCRYIELSNFKIEEVAHFVQRFEGIVKQPLKVMEEILFWSGGQPFLTQKLCQIVINYLGERGVEEVYNDVALVEDLVNICVVENWDAQDYPVHFSKIQNLLLKNIQKSTSHLEIYQQLLKHSRLKPPGENNQRFKNDAIANSKWEIKELLRSGIAKINQGFLEVYSPIYAEIFNQEWVEQYLAQITQSVPIVPRQKLELNEFNSQEQSWQKGANISNLEIPENYKISSNSAINPQQKQVGNPLELNELNTQVTNFQLGANISNLANPENRQIHSNDGINPQQKQLENPLELNELNSQEQSFQKRANISNLT